MFSPTRAQVREFFIGAWRKRLEHRPASPLEALAADIIAWHPEYHALLSDPEALMRDWTPADGVINPFLHLSLHLAIEEQLSIDQPPGIRAALGRRLARRGGDRHAALHDLLECLGETLWKAQRAGKTPDGDAYLDCVNRLI
ncbi:MAG: DUF1841 family protein [Rhodocyclaceae bacterium]|nr:DUF1841 family protein [Rhodocyclaceae bacterium]